MQKPRRTEYRKSNHKARNPNIKIRNKLKIRNAEQNPNYPVSNLGFLISNFEFHIFRVVLSKEQVCGFS